MGATYDAQKGFLVLDRDVELNTERAGEPVQIHAQHAEFERSVLLCRLRAATADYRGGEATAAEAKILFRNDGSAVRLDAANGFALATVTGGHLSAPTGSLDFDQHNQPRHGHLEGGVRMDSSTPNRQIHATSPTAELQFTPQGQLHHAHLERGVEMHSEELTSAPASSKSPAVPTRVARTWRAPVTDIDFRPAANGQTEPATIHGEFGVVVTGERQRGGAPSLPSRLAADQLTGDFGPNSSLSVITGAGHAAIEETTASGAADNAAGDRLEAHFLPTGAPSAKAPASSATGGPAGNAQIQSAVLDGHVVLIQTPAAKPGTPPGAPLRANAGRAVYEGAGQWLHLTLSPHVDDGTLQLAAAKIDVSQESGDAFAHSDVKATWLNAPKSPAGQSASPNAAVNPPAAPLGGQGPAHAVADEAQLHRAAGQAVFRGNARLWQQANSVAAPLIVLDRANRTLAARSSDPAGPVRVVLLSAGGLQPASTTSPASAAAPSVIRVRGGSFNYSDPERKAIMLAGDLGPVLTETGSASCLSNRVELFLLPAGAQSRQGQQGQVDRMIASGRVQLNSEGRRGTGEQLTYTARTGEYVLTGTASAPPRISDPARGMATGEALIFHTGDDSVSIEGGGHPTRTDTTFRQREARSEPHK